MPEHVVPMLARLADLPRDDRDYGFEIKWDGVRAISYCEGGHVRLESRNLRDVTAQYPELRALGRELGSHRAVLDGEIVALDEQGRPNFQRLQPRMHVDVRIDDPAAHGGHAGRLHDLRPALPRRPLDDAAAVHRAPRAARGARPERRRTGRRPPTTSATARRCSRRAASRASRAWSPSGSTAATSPGARSGAWLKIKNHLRQEFVIGGWLPGKGGRSDTLGSLAVGYYEDGQAALRRQRRHRLHGADARGPAASCWSRCERPESPFEGRQPPKGTDFVEPRAGRGGRVRRMDHDTNVPPALFQGPSGRQRSQGMSYLKESRRAMIGPSGV